MNDNQIISAINEIFKKPNIQEEKDFVSSHIALKEDEICKRLIGTVGEMRLYFVNAAEVGIKFFMDFVDGGNDMAYGINSKKALSNFIPNFEIWLDSHIDLFELRFVAIHELYEREKMRYTDMDYEEAHDLANKLEKNLKKQFFKKFLQKTK